MLNPDLQYITEYWDDNDNHCCGEPICEQAHGDIQALIAEINRLEQRVHNLEFELNDVEMKLQSIDRIIRDR